MTHTTLEQGRYLYGGSREQVLAQGLNSTIAQQPAQGSILILLWGIPVQLKQHELVILTSVPKDPSPVPKAMEFWGVALSIFALWWPPAAVPQGLPRGITAEGDWDHSSLQVVRVREVVQRPGCGP